MHADVGGGYPDESLSYVSLLWMMEEAERAGLRTLKVIKDRIVALASSYGPIHDSRGGAGAYYRYQPRKIAAWLDPVDPKTLSLRDPAITDSRGRSRGLLCTVKVHESVINRIANGTDRYAPITLPKTLEIVPPQLEGENIAQADNEMADRPADSTAPKPMVSQSVRTRLLADGAGEARAKVTEPIWNYVWWRRLTYFATLAATLLLLILPMIVGRLPPPPILEDGRAGIGRIIGLLTLVLPAFAAGWVEVYADNPFYFLVFVATIFALLKIGKRLERRLRDEARRMWKAATEGELRPEPRASWVQNLRNGRGYQRFIQRFKWYFLPDWIVAPLLVALMFWVALAVYAQMRLPFLEHDAWVCQAANGVRQITTERRDFRTRDICSGSFGLVTATERYIVTFDVVDAWSDSTVATSPKGLGVGDSPWGFGYVAAPFRRVIDAHYLQPVLEIRPIGREDHLTKNIQIYPLAVDAVGNSATLYRAEFRAALDGELFLFANDAMIPLTASVWGKYGYRHFYEESGSDTRPGNHGTACVTVERASAGERTMVAPPAGSICQQAEERNAAGAKTAAPVLVASGRPE
jgi:hypothetical protein